jgi:hypothetical protein
LVAIPCGFESHHRHQLRNAPFGMSPRLTARPLSRTGRFFAFEANPQAGFRAVQRRFTLRYFTCAAGINPSLRQGFAAPPLPLNTSIFIGRRGNPRGSWSAGKAGPPDQPSGSQLRRTTPFSSRPQELQFSFVLPLFHHPAPAPMLSAPAAAITFLFTITKSIVSVLDP